MLTTPFQFHPLVCHCVHWAINPLCFPYRKGSPMSLQCRRSSNVVTIPGGLAFWRMCQEGSRSPCYYCGQWVFLSTGNLPLVRSGKLFPCFSKLNLSVRVLPRTCPDPTATTAHWWCCCQHQHPLPPVRSVVGGVLSGIPPEWWNSLLCVFLHVLLCLHMWICFNFIIPCA